MKIKIIFTDPTDTVQSIHTTQDEKVMLIHDPYTITMVDWGRHIISATGEKVTYEVYLKAMQTLITDTLKLHHLEEAGVCDALSIEGCKEPPNFEAVARELASTPIHFSSQCELLFKNCSFGGALFVNAAIKMVNSAKRHKQKVLFTITVEEESKTSLLSEHDKAKLALINGVIFFPEPQSNPVVRRFTDDQLLQTKQAHLLNPSSFFQPLPNKRPSLQTILMNFFSQTHQQQSDFTCGPAALKMIADYYCSMTKRLFCGEPIARLWHDLNHETELALAERVKTTEEEGSDIENMREGLLALGFSVIDNCNGPDSAELDELSLTEQKLMLWENIRRVLELGIPVVINLRNHENIGHYEVAVGIDDNEQIIFAEPGRALEGKIEFEVIAKEQFIERWKNHRGTHHGRFMIISPNEATAAKVDSIFSAAPHYFNGLERKPDLQCQSRV